MPFWAVGLPKTHEPSSTDDAIEHIESNTVEILDWLMYIAKAILAHKESLGYQMQKRKSGQTKETGHGLTAAEHEERTEARKCRHSQFLARQWARRELTYDTCNNYQWTLLTKFWNGKLCKSTPGTKPNMLNFVLT